MDEVGSFGQFIAKRRREKMMTQSELATKIGVSKSAIAKWETDRGIPDWNNYFKLARVMNVSAEKLQAYLDN